MGLRSISYQGFKGAPTTEIALAALNLFVGKVGSGKSTAPDALRFGGLGFVPAIGRSAAAVERLAGPDGASVGATLDDGRAFLRELVRDGKGGTTQRVRASWIPADATATEHSEAIRSLFGASVDEASEHLDLRQLLNATGNQRAARITALLDATSAPADTFKAVARGLLVSRILRLPDAAVERVVSGTVEEIRARVAGLEATLPPDMAEAYRPFAADLERWLGEEGIEKTLAWVNSTKRNAAKDAKGKKAARAEIENRSAAIGTPTDTLSAIVSRRDGAAAREATAKARIEVLDKALEARLAAVARLQRADGAVQAAAGGVERARVLRESAKAKREEAGRLAEPAEIPALDVSSDVTLGGIRERLASLAGDHDKAAVEHEALVGAAPAGFTPATVPALLSEPSHASIDSAERDLLSLRGSPWRTVDEFARRLDFMGTDARPPMNELVEIGEALRNLARTHGGGSVEDAERLVRSMRESYNDAVVAYTVRAEEVAKVQGENRIGGTAAKTAADDHRARVTASRRDLVARQAAIETVEKEASARETALREAHANAVADRSVVVDEVTRSRRRLLKDADAAEADAVVQESALATAEAELNAARGGLGATNSNAEAEKALEIAARDAACKERTDADLARRTVEAADARRREMDTLTAEIERATATEVACREAEWALQRLRDRMMNSRTAPLVEAMARFLRRGGRTEEPFLRAEGGACDFGWRNARGREVMVEVLSGGEFVMFVAALAFAVVLVRKPELRLLIVEGAETGDGETFPALLKGLAASSAEWGGTIVVATCSPSAASDAGPEWRSSRFVEGGLSLLSAATVERPALAAGGVS